MSNGAGVGSPGKSSRNRRQVQSHLSPGGTLAAGHHGTRNRRFGAWGAPFRPPRWSIKPQGTPLMSPSTGDRASHRLGAQRHPAVPNGENFSGGGPRVGFVRELRENWLGWWGGEAGESHSTHETCVFLRSTVRNSNSNCRPQPPDLPVGPRAGGGRLGRYQLPWRVRKRVPCVSKVDQLKGAFGNAAACGASHAQNGPGGSS